MPVPPPAARVAAMPITLNCGCGKVLRIADQHAGKRVKCPACNGILSTAAPQPAFEVVEEEPRQRSPARPVAQPARPRPDQEDDDDSYSVRKAERSSSKPQPAFRRSADDRDEPRPRRKKKRKTRRQPNPSFFASPDAGRRIGFIVGGGFALVLGVSLVVWGNDGEGRGATRLLIFGVLLAIGGLISVVQGVTGNMPDPDDE